jgi:hypothetical protein
MRWKEIREGLASQRAHARQSRVMLRAMDASETALAEARAAWEAGHPVRSAEDLAVLVSASRPADREAAGWGGGNRSATGR